MSNQEFIKQKFFWFTIVVVLIFGSLFIRLFCLQVVNAAEFRTQSENNRTHMTTIPARRGDILDRQGRVLATSLPVFTVSITEIEKEKLQQTFNKLLKILDDCGISYNREEVEEKLQSQRRLIDPLEVTRLAWGQDAVAVISRIEEKRSELPGVAIRVEPLRYYPNEELAGHVLGFIGQISEQELEQFREYKYGLHDKIGKFGLERIFEVFEEGGNTYGLRGRKGFDAVEVDAGNRIVRELTTVPPTPGDTLVLTLDLNLQRALEEALDEAIDRAKTKNSKAGAGAGIVLDVKSGAILAMASKPHLNPNDFVDGSYVQKREYYEDQRLKPAFNRAIQGAYPPGSTFKMVTGMAALEAGVVKASETIKCTGRYWKPPFIKDWKTHGRVNYYSAIAQSCNTYFQHVADLTGIQEIVWVAREFGLGQKTGLKDLSGEVEGILPTPLWKEKVGQAVVENNYRRKKETLNTKYQPLLAEAENPEEHVKIGKAYQKELKDLEDWYRKRIWENAEWHPYDTFNTSIGQGSNNYSILQLANYIAALANGEWRYQPYLVQKIISPEGENIKVFSPKAQKKITVSNKVLEETKRGMLAVTSRGGTAHYLFHDFPPDVQVGAKTGTAQTGRAQDNKRKDFHGVFVAFAPFNNPEIAMAVIVEYAEDGGSSAGRVTRSVLQEYFGIGEAKNR